MDRPRIGVSACLLGAPVRYDGGHKRDRFVQGELSRFVDFVPICPEVEAGMAVPREPIRLVARESGVVVLGNRSGVDYTARLTAAARARVEDLAGEALDGFILKKDSPSCGLERVRVYRGADDRQSSRGGTGTFAAVLRERLPWLPLTEEGWLHDAGLRDSFLERIFTHHRLRISLYPSTSRAALVAFHAENKLLYMAHSPARARALGHIVATADGRPIEETLALYEAQVMATLCERTTPGKHANVLQHMLGFFRGALSASDRHELMELIEDFRAGLYTLSVPLALFAHHVRKHQPDGWLARQTYFHPYPRALSA